MFGNFLDPPPPRGGEGVPHIVKNPYTAACANGILAHCGRSRLHHNIDSAPFLTIFSRFRPLPVSSVLSAYFQPLLIIARFDPLLARFS